VNDVDEMSDEHDENSEADVRSVTSDGTKAVPEATPEAADGDNLENPATLDVEPVTAVDLLPVEIDKSQVGHTVNVEWIIEVNIYIIPI